MHQFIAARERLVEHVRADRTLATLDRAMHDIVEPLPIPSEHKSALWLLGWSELDPRRQRMEAQAMLELALD